jgi:hypothetical protein
MLKTADGSDAVAWLDEPSYLLTVPLPAIPPAVQVAEVQLAGAKPANLHCCKRIAALWSRAMVMVAIAL